jgi:hypothetical protein
MRLIVVLLGDGSVAGGHRQDSRREVSWASPELLTPK